MSLKEAKMTSLKDQLEEEARLEAEKLKEAKLKVEESKPKKLKKK